MTEDVETQFHTIDLFVRDILSDMKTVSKSTTKPVMLAHMSAWQNTLETIKHIIDI
tara:strand:- start:176 stop:343 length:168 start_codon:yes stop_codon:yes gene_type:complete